LGSCGAKIVKIRSSKLALPDETVGLIFVLLSREGLSCFTVPDVYSRLKECVTMSSFFTLLFILPSALHKINEYR